MIEAFSVDRRAVYEVGEDLKYYTNLDSNPVYAYVPFQTDRQIRQRIQELYSDGLSPHGIQYLFGELEFPDGYASVSPVLELIWESVRRESFPERPSRYRSYYGVRTLDAAVAFREKSNSSTCSIYKLSSDHYFEADMNLLSFSKCSMSTLDMAHRYWSGEISSQPQVEILLSGKVAVLEVVDDPADSRIENMSEEQVGEFIMENY